MTIEDIESEDIKGFLELIKEMAAPPVVCDAPNFASPRSGAWKHPLIGKRVLVRTYSAGVHIGTLVSVNPDNSMECHLKDALRLWKWTGGGLSLSAIAHNGIKGGRLNRTDEVVLTGAIEYIPTTEAAEATYGKFIEDVED